MKLFFQCEQCLALHADVDACRKCSHVLDEQIDFEAQSAASFFVAANSSCTVPALEQVLAERLHNFAIDMMRGKQRR